MKRTALCPYGRILDMYSSYGFAFLAANASAKTTNCGLTECHIRHYHHSFHTILLLTKVILFTAREV